MLAVAFHSNLFLSPSVGLLMKNESLAEERASEFGGDTKFQTLVPEWKLVDANLEPAHYSEHAVTADGSAQAVYGCGQERASYRGHEYIEHGGSNPGFKTQVIRFPQDGFGVISLSNDELGNGLMETVKWRLIDSVLGMEPIDWTARYRESHNKRYKESQDVTPRPSSPKAPSSCFAAMHETFTHRAHGPFSPCYVASGPTGLTPGSNAASMSPVVQDVFSASPSAL
ncbi:unnamed protein product [Mycena citricolor]|uniref:Beta-lactamase-related domain-containing protein n=1 Tax=Mycena citricolor TaxID=2018698 RepID=A0AAD2H3T0_9AGAR|nr:unnamed protein product [Mycena citricolor]